MSYNNNLIASVVDEELQRLIQEGKYYVINAQGLGTTFSIVLDGTNVANVYDRSFINMPYEREVKCSEFIDLSMLRPIENTHVESATLTGPMGTESLIGSRIYSRASIKGYIEYTCPIIHVSSYTLIPSAVNIHGTCVHQVSIDVDYDTGIKVNSYIKDSLEYVLGHNDNFVDSDIKAVVNISTVLQHNRMYSDSITFSSNIDSTIYHHIEPQHHVYLSEVNTCIDVVNNLHYVRLENMYIINYTDKIILAGDIVNSCIMLPDDVISTPIKL